MKPEKVERLYLDNPWFAGFARWLVNECHFNVGELVNVIDKPWKWTNEFNNEYIPYLEGND